MSDFPSHIENFVTDASTLFPGKTDDYHHYFRVVCTCGSNLFYLFFGTKRSVHGICQKCLQNVTIYDLDEYPAATKPKGEETFELRGEIAKPSQVFVGYEYGQLDDGEEFDRNDIAWCQIFIEANSEIVKVFDDETA